MKLKYFLLLCGLTTISGVSTQALAQTQSDASVTSPSGTEMQQDAAKEPVIQLYQALSAVQKTSKDSLLQHTAILNQALDNSYDFPAIIAKTVGYRYSAFTPQEKETVLTAFKKYTVARYLSSFTDGSDTQFKIAPEVKTASAGTNQIVTTTIGSGSDETQINYIVHKTPQGWRIIDVLLNGNISQTAVQRGDFSSTLAKGGSQALISMLDKKTQSFNKQK